MSYVKPSVSSLGGGNEPQSNWLWLDTVALGAAYVIAAVAAIGIEVVI
ncbi:hypothetical protein [Gorillibacterium sp. sgz500922]